MSCVSRDDLPVVVWGAGRMGAAVARQLALHVRQLAKIISQAGVAAPLTQQRRSKLEACDGRQTAAGSQLRGVPPQLEGGESCCRN